MARFIFHGNAMPFGGRITKKGDAPFMATIPGPPAAALPVTGGHSRASSGSSKPHEAFGWGSTLAEAKGEQLAANRYQTTITSEITKIFANNKPHVFEADVLRIVLVSDHPNLKAPVIRIKEVVFGQKLGMRLDGERIDVEYNDDLDKNPTFSAFQDRYQSNKDFFARHQALKKKVSFGDPPPRTTAGYVQASIVRSVTWKKKKYPGNSLRLTGFGTIYFGEVLMNENNRRFTMVRLEMGSELGASCACAEADPNGTWGN